MSNEHPTPEQCLSHLDYTEQQCPDCGEHVDAYGNTEYDFRYCSFPNCGCDGARLCMAKEGASKDAAVGNVEGMWSGKTKQQREAVMRLIHRVNSEAK